MFLVIFIYFLLFSYLIINASSKKNQHNEKTEFKGFVSVVIAVKNEQNRISKLLKALSRQNFDRNQFEIIIVDDNSNDDTITLIRYTLST